MVVSVIVSLERAAIVQAISSSSNLDDAARKLGASRRTLQNRMRHYGIPRGKSGRPRRKLKYSKKRKAWSVGVAATAVAMISGAVLLGRGRGA